MMWGPLQWRSMEIALNMTWPIQKRKLRACSKWQSDAVNGCGALVSDKPGLQTQGLELFNWVYLHIFPTSIGGDICLLSNVKHISAGVPHLSSNQWHADNRSRSVFRQTQDASQHAVATLQVLGFADGGLIRPKTISKVRMGSSLEGCYWDATRKTITHNFPPLKCETTI